MIKIAICDDEKNIRIYLRTLVRKQDKESEIAEYASADVICEEQKTALRKYKVIQFCCSRGKMESFTAKKGRFTAIRFIMKFYSPIDLKEAEYG